MCSRSPQSDAERGSATVLVTGLVAVVLVLMIVVAGLGRAAHARGTAQMAADLAALAAASELHAPGGTAEAACLRAREVATANGAAVTGCVPARGVITVWTETRVRTAGAGSHALVGAAEARAGPAGVGPSPAAVRAPRAAVGAEDGGPAPRGHWWP